MTSSNSAAVNSNGDFCIRLMAPQFTSTSMTPYFWRTVSKNCFMSASCRKSMGRYTIFSPVKSAVSGKSVAMTKYPAAAKPSARVCPMPPVAPVMTACFMGTPSSLYSFIIQQKKGGKKAKFCQSVLAKIDTAKQP